MKPRPITQLVLALVLAAPLARSDDALSAHLTCRAVASPGRVACEIEIETGTGRLAWVDVLVRRSPDFARPLRARVGMRQATSRAERRVRLPVVLVATGNGRGDLEVQARAVVCRASSGGRELCTSELRASRAAVQVGPVHEEPP